jgi:hypothetical protein
MQQLVRNYEILKSCVLIREILRQRDDACV